MKLKLKHLRTKKLKNKKSLKKGEKTVSKKKKQPIKFPAKVIAPVGVFLKAQLKKLERRKKTIEQEDPFEDTSRTMDNASPDTDAYEQTGHARTSAIKEQLDKKIIQTKKALTRIKVGKYGICEDCGEMIDTDRLMVYPEATLCAKCQGKRES
jgi:RNA polymerase-binding transcription factor DksA